MKTSLFRSDLAASAVLLAALLVAPGCPHSDSAPTATESALGAQADQNQFRGPLKRNALHVLNGLEQFDEGPAIEQVVDRLNQWSRSQDAAVAWKLDPLLATLPDRYQSTLWFGKLQDKAYDHQLDGDFLKEAVWLRDISKHAVGHDLDDLAVAQALFDWTIRNVELIEAPFAQAGNRLADWCSAASPPTSCCKGRGRQHAGMGLHAAGASTGARHRDAGRARSRRRPGKQRFWLPALLHQGQLYLFDTTLGLAIPGPGGKGIATLAQAAEDESVLGSLDLDENHHYGFKAAEAKQATAYIEASPGYLARRMKVLQSQLVGDEGVVLSASPEQIAGRLKGIAHLAPEVKLWTLPYDTYALRQLDRRGSPQFQQVLTMDESPFKVPGYHGAKSTVIKPGERLERFKELVAEGENPDEKRIAVVTPGKAGLNSRIMFSVKSEQANFDKVDIVFENNPAIAAEHETVEFDRKNPQQPKLIFQIAEGKTTVTDILRAVTGDTTVSGLFDVSKAAETDNGEGLVSVADSTTATRVTIKQSSDAKRPMQIVFPLWAGRLLHFRGVYDGESGAKHFYMAARPGTDQFGEYVAELITDFQEAYKQPLTPDTVQKFTWAILRRKQDATYWLGLISFDEGQYEAAEEYFKMVPQEVGPNIPSPWIAAAKYNLARAYEASGRTADAIKLLEEDDSPQRFGNHLRARTLKAAAKPATEK